MSRRRPKSNPVSLFAFQDIITATTGILILLTLVLAISVITQGASADIPSVTADANELAERTALLSEVEHLRKKSWEIANETAALSSATPSELERKIDALTIALEMLQSELPQLEQTLEQQKSQLESAQKSPVTAKLQADIIRLEQQIAELSASVQSLKDGNRVIYNFRVVERTPWLVEISDSQVLAVKFNSDQPQRFTSAAAFNRFAVGLPEQEQYAVLILKPSGLSNYDLIKNFLDERAFDIGTELIGEAQSAVHPTKGTNF